jgi:hypothetical protein
MLDVSWNELRSHRDELLSKSDWRFMSDQTPSQEWIDYRQFFNQYDRKRKYDPHTQ